MQLVNFIGSAIVFLIFLSCEDINHNNQLIGVVRKHSYKGFDVKDTLTLSVKKENDSLFFVRCYKNLKHSIKTTRLINNDSILVGENAVYRLLKHKAYSINGKDYIVYKYLFDEEGKDEEEDIFFTEEYGVIYSRLWWFEFGSSYEYDSISTRLVRLITSDTTGFFKEIIAPPPPPLSGNN